MYRIILVALAALVLSACANRGAKTTTTTPLDPETVRKTWLSHQEQLSRLNQWSIKGKAAIRSPEQSGTVSLFWRQSLTDFDLKFVAPFGRGTLDIKSDDDGVSMVDAKGREHRAATAQGLVWMKTGWDIPFDEMRGWVLGIADDPHNPSLRVDAQGRTLGFNSKGWEVSYPAYRTVNTHQGKIELPRKIYIKSKNLVVKLAIADWSLGVEEVAAP